MTGKLIFLLESPFNKRDYKRFGIEILQRNWFTVEAWDLTPVFHPNLQLTPPDPVEFNGLRPFATRSEVDAALRELSSDDMIITWFFYPRYFWLYRAIGRCNAEYSAMLMASIPPHYAGANVSSSRKSIFKRARKIMRMKPWQLLEGFKFAAIKLFASLPYRLFGIKPITYWFAATANTLESYQFPCDEATRVVFLHVFDYDLFLEKKQGTEIQYANNAVFLDIYAPFHEDHEITGSPHLITAEKYYPSLCAFFDYVEKDRGTVVDIAAHPRSHYGDHPDYFNKRTLRSAKTIEMVRDAGFVITHDSTSINFAIMYYKPIIFIVTDEMVRNNATGMVRQIASWFGKVPINIDEPFSIDWKKELSVDKEQYDSYIHTFIKMKGTEQKNSWQLVADNLKTK